MGTHWWLWLGKTRDRWQMKISILDLVLPPVLPRDNWNYIPVPVLLPLASIGYGPATFQMTYIPGTYNNGNVYFAWMRFQF